MGKPHAKSLKRKPEDIERLQKPSKSPKNKPQLSEINTSSHSPLQVEDDVPDFPRGGGSSLSRKEELEVRAEVDAEFARELKTKKKSSKQKTNNVVEDDLGSLFGEGGITGKLPKFANKITLKNVSSGMKLWGVISEVNEKDLVVSLPGGLRGLVRKDEASDLISENRNKDSENLYVSSIFSVGQLVACVVVQVDEDKIAGKGRTKIWLSLCLSLLHKGITFDAIQEGMVLTAYVKSIEDHGYILHFGSSSFTGFLPRIEKDSSEVKVNVGQLLQGIVRTVDKTRQVVHLSSDRDEVSKCVIKDLKGISIDLLVPGMMVNTRVQSTLENGIMLSFLTYFTGTVDIFHLQNPLPTTNWKDDYGQNKRVVARILFIDPSTRAVGLTMNPHLVHNKAPPLHVKIGEIFESSRVVRVDRGLGLLLEIPSSPEPTPAYVSIFDVADEEIRKLEKKFKEGNRVRLRILGFRSLEGLATGVLKATAFEGSVFTHSDVKPGMVVKGKVVSVESYGAIVQFLGGVKALCPLPHMSEFDVVKPGKKFKVGADLVFRVLGIKSKRITVTHKKSLVKSKLGILSSHTDAVNGFVTHGYISKIEKHGCFVRFYNGVQGLVPRSELGLEPGCEASSMFHVGQVVKCRVIHAVPASRRISLSFIISPTSVPVDDKVQLGSLVSGVVERLTPNSVIVKVNAKGYPKGSILTAHLADNQGHSLSMKSMLKPGHEFDQLLVLDTDGHNLILSAKYSLINAAKELPMDVTQVQPHLVVQGYICNIIEAGCFVRFLGHFTGFSPRHKATLDKKTDIFEAFYIGQSVRSHVLDANSESSRITLSLNQTSCFSTDASYINGYFHSEDKLAMLQNSDSESSTFNWVEKFNIESVVEGVIHEKKEFGVILSFKEQNDVFGFVSHYHLGGNTIETGAVVRAMVLDIAKSERLVDLSLKPELITTRMKEDASSDSLVPKKKRKRDKSMILELHQTVNVVVEIVKENYLVLSLPDFNHAIGFASVTDYNTSKLPHKHFSHGQSAVATVVAVSDPSTGGKLLLLLKSLFEVEESSSSKRAKKKSSCSVGSLVEAEITDIKPLELRLKFGIGFRGRVHITEVNNVNMEDPFSKYKIGQQITAKIVGKANHFENNEKNDRWELSIRPRTLADAGSTVEVNDMLMTEFTAKQSVTGYVLKVDKEWVWLTVSRHVRAKLFILDTSCEPNELEEFQKRFTVGKAVTGRVLSINKEKQLLRLVLRSSPVPFRGEPGNEDPLENVNEHIHESDLVGGRITKVLPGVNGLLVQIGPHFYGKVHFTELTDKFVDNPLAGYVEGQFVKCKVVEVSHSAKGTTHFDLSLRHISETRSTNLRANTEMDIPRNQAEKIEDLHPNMAVQGYIKNVMSKGCFIMLSRKVDAKILLSNLSDRFIVNPEKEFPVGKLVNGKVLSVEPLSKRVEVTLRTGFSNNATKSDIASIHVGDIITGRIKQIMPYGLFITIGDTKMAGLCHISELSDDGHIDNIESTYRAGESVKAKILKVDEERNRINLGMKDSYVRDETSHVNQDSDEEAVDRSSDFDDDSENIALQTSNLPISTLSDDECLEDGRDYPVLALPNSSRATVLPLEVTLDDDIEGSDSDNIKSKTPEEPMNGVDPNSEKSNRRLAKKAKQVRELEIGAAEQRSSEKDIPRTADEFEKAVRNSPNSSFVWIKYMAFMLSLADIEKARSVAEQALETINIREEAEKLNVWLAYFNLENEYGNPREEAVTKIFQRALQYCDPKKIHLALLGMYEKTEQQNLANELLDQMIKKFKRSCKVWLTRIQSSLKQGKDETQSLVKRALLTLPRHKHIKFISQTAILEFKRGVPDRGRSMFEEMLREYPKRTDLWSIYLDQEIRLGDTDVIRALFERATSLSLPHKKIQFLFTKYLNYEKVHGDEEKVENVKNKAMEYAKSLLA
ncbi:hypothetical protein GIB67_038442 [Kingdonia uniflora]|uniref:Protein RRP5 homolog n=1 Tax=Kingdonia uniflora TaxID=39325 RepID=A0A7J7NP29_9MAGN|nr:hypothetical protein GIB67_038442 [Kingdonia uniflora]